MTAVALFGAHTLTPLEVLPGLALAWVVWLSFFVGARRGSDRPLRPADPAIATSISRRLPVLAVLATVAAVFIAQFYTGNTPQDVVAALSSGSSLYQEYQAYFADQQLSVLSMRKVLPVLSGALLKFTLVALFAQALVIERDLRPRSVVPLVIVSGAYLFFSLTRGTSFEIFELFVLLWFSMVIRQRRHGRRRSSLTARLWVVAAAVALLAIFNYNLEVRAGFEYARSCVTSEICHAPDSLLQRASPLLGNLSFRISGYAVFGVFFVSSLLTGSATSPDLLMASAVPFGFVILGNTPPELVCGRVIDCGVHWIPDVVAYTETFGLIGVVLLVFVLGRVSRKLAKSVELRPNIVSVMLLYFVALTVISLPVGNFVVVASSNRLSLLAAVGLYVVARVRGRSRGSATVPVGVTGPRT